MLKMPATTARVVIFRPSVEPEVTTIDTSLESMQAIVDGYLGGLQLGEGLFLYFDEDGRPKGKPTCAYVHGLVDTVVGVCIATGLDDAGDIRGLTDDEIVEVKRQVITVAFVAKERFQA